MDNSHKALIRVLLDALYIAQRHDMRLHNWRVESMEQGRPRVFDFMRKTQREQIDAAIQAGQQELADE